MEASLSPYERILRSLGIKKIRRGYATRYLDFPADFTPENIRLHRKVERYTMTRPERVFSLVDAVKYAVKNNVEGSFVECGVWRGGSVMAMALTLIDLNAERDIYLFDTFAGMTEPSAHDKTVRGASAVTKYRNLQTSSGTSTWDYASLSEVMENVLSTGYNPNRLHFIEGRVEETLPDRAPEEIAIVRLDTDFYESTKHELVHLFPRLASKGVLILDDYGHWRGARKAVDEYFEMHPCPILLNRIDFAARIAIKP